LENWQKKELRAASDKNKYYQDAIFLHRLAEAKTAARQSSQYQLHNGIFMPSGMKEKFDRIEVLGWEALTESELNKVYGIREPNSRAKQLAFLKEGEALIKSLERDVQARLWSVGQSEKN
jgi:hypothetical protein